jgi:hypothetical protein
MQHRSNLQNGSYIISSPGLSLKPYERFWKTLKRKTVLGVGAKNSAEALKKEKVGAESDNQEANAIKDT